MSADESNQPTPDARTGDVERASTPTAAAPPVSAADELARAIARHSRATLWWGGLCVASFVIGYAGRWIPEPWILASFIAIPVWIVSLFMVVASRARLKRDARRQMAVPLTAPPPAAPVLYLRSFSDDQAAARLLGKLTEEEHLAKVLSSIGPVIAIGRPGEFKPELGAARIYVGDADWQATIEAHIPTARLVVIRTGFSEGLRWELDRALRLLTPERLMIVVDSGDELREFLAQVRAVHPHLRAAVRLGYRSIGSVRGFLVFDEQWQMSSLTIRRSALSKRQDGSVVGPRFSRTLRPVFERLNAPWQRPERDWAKVALALCGGAIVGTLLVSAMS